jgi:uncharacterized protein (DUF2141 family)
MKDMYLVLIYLFMPCIQNIYADVPLILEIQNVVINGGTIYFSIYSNEISYRNKEPYMTFQRNPIDTVISQEIRLPEGDYLMGAYQDSNGNGKLDNSIFGFPKEPVAMTNYDGGIPGNFNKLKVRVDNTTAKIIIYFITF